ncbi:bifunctional diguanylate cyclase/phosphodiesterase [Pseudoduganella lutea]|uniref:EAL domain-containing protein n=1 Tax=Pseudoduganella lutea TaxID=321985 RepID=A0A4P6KUZ7_9BURK|nr:bifunctional diguanylate cyclase/phosphodiesterase [Pseudoduganella lutea]QBE62485.1 EAL domain-containing protein [Pseudoduganella lutea]
MNDAPAIADPVTDALQLIGMPACACDGGGIVVASNAEFDALLARDPRGMAMVDLFARHMRGDGCAALEAALAGGDTAAWDSCVIAAAGRYVAVQVTVKPFPAALGRRGATILLHDIGAVQRDQQALRKALLEQRAILENAAVGIIFSKHDHVQECNMRAAEMFGYARHEMEGKPSLMLYPDVEQFDTMRERWMPVLHEGQSVTLETPMKRGDGALFWCRAHGRAVDPSDRQAGMVWIVEDISEQRAASEATRKILLEQKAILDNASVGILFTKNQHMLSCNPRIAAMFGYAPDEMIGMHAGAVFPSEQVYREFGAEAGPLLAHGRPFEKKEFRFQRKDGSLFWCRVRAKAVDQEQNDGGTIWILEDVTLSRQNQMESEALMNNASISILFTRERTITRHNRGFAEMFRYGSEEANGMSCEALYPSVAAYEALSAQAGPLLAAARPFQTEIELRRKDGSTFWAQLIAYVVNPDAPEQGTIWIAEDRTEHKAAEESLRQAADSVRRARDELEIRVLERTAELAGANTMLQGEIVERRQAEARVHHMAYHDSLTGLPNRALLTDRVERAVLNAQRTGRSLAVMFLDLDRFKTINDSLGHLTGDALLKEVAGRLCRAVRASDTVARLGGDEFVVLAPHIRDSEEAAQVAEKIIDALAPPFPLDGHTLHITPSIGICICPDDGQDVETLMRHADAAMYHAKAAGRNNYQFFTQKMNSAATFFELESSLRSALAQDQFELHFQPIIDIGSRRLHSLEVLLRWRRPGSGLVGPDKFIPILEENGLIVPVGEWVIRRACEQSMEWKRQGLQPVPLAVNLSPRQFMHRGLMPAIRRILDETGIDPALLEFEITETALMQHGEQTLDILGQINAMGIRLSIDDFGTGYSSLAYLKRFPVKKIKIDRAFIKDLEKSAEDRAIVAAIIALSDSLQLSVVAEGVETEGHYALLQQQGCQFAQGYLFSQPVPRANAGNLLERLDCVQSRVAITGV